MLPPEPQPIQTPAAKAVPEDHLRQAQIPSEPFRLQPPINESVSRMASRIHWCAGYAQGYQAGDRERENSMAHRQIPTDSRAPAMASKGCARIVAQNFGVSTHHVHITKARSPAKHEWLIEAAVGHDYMVCQMRDTGEVIDVRGGTRL